MGMLEWSGGVFGDVSEFWTSSLVLMRSWRSLGLEMGVLGWGMCVFGNVMDG